MTPRQYDPTPEERDEKVNTNPDDMPAEKLIAKILKAGPHPKDDEERKKKS